MHTAYCSAQIILFIKCHYSLSSGMARVSDNEFSDHFFSFLFFFFYKKCSFILFAFDFSISVFIFFLSFFIKILFIFNLVLHL